MQTGRGFRTLSGLPAVVACTQPVRFVQGTPMKKTLIALAALAGLCTALPSFAQFA
jgi:hypothetical protein